MLNFILEFFKKPKIAELVECESDNVIPLVRPAPLTAAEMSEIEDNARLRHALYDEPAV